MNKTKVENVKIVKGFGVVGTWRNPVARLGRTLPQWLSDTPSSAKGEANGNQRLFQFIEDTEQWLCEIIIKPIKKLKPRKQFIDI